VTAGIVSEPTAAPATREPTAPDAAGPTATTAGPMAQTVADRCAVDIAVTGVVQGVGFRPFVHRLAIRHGVAGWVRNESGAVRIRAEGTAEAIEGFVAELPASAPPLTRLDRITVSSVAPARLADFEVAPSEHSGHGRLPVSPDVATCAACEAELRDPSNRRYRYPFITCTDCGPRFTVIEEMPYDRERTTMRVFTQCARCRAEYDDPTDRRYHSETNSCASCGPSLWFESSAGVSGSVVSGRSGSDGNAVTARSTATMSDQVIERGATLLRGGGILALRGLGGFHLAVRADDEDAVGRLRHRKARESKPLAVMVRDLDDARLVAEVSEAEARLLVSAERPVVVLRRRPDAGLAAAVSPGLGTVGVVLAYSPLHHLLLDALSGVPLVMTSGNASEEPIAISNDEARARLSHVADAFLLHDREIVARYDDSVVRVAATGPIMLRRARGYAPIPLTLPIPVEDGILAVGPHLKNTFTLAQGSDAFVSQHVGDLGNLETLRHFEDARARFAALFGIDPRWVVRDLHPGYLSTAIAEECGLTELPPVQHHHAHVAAVMAEHGVTEQVLGLAFDGTGYGTDGRTWGCELLVADLRGFERVGHLRYAPLPGGDRAARTPWRSLLGYASLGFHDGASAQSPGDGEPGSDRGTSAPSPDHHASGSRDLDWIRPALAGVDPVEVAVARHQMARALNTPMASSLGRLFDAAAALLGIRSVSRYEGQAAMELEAAATGVPGRVLPFPIVEDGDGASVLDPLPLLRALAAEHRAGRSVAECAADFQESVVHATSRLAVDLCARAGLGTVALGGGCFQNARLLDGLASKLSNEGLVVLIPRALGPNDGAVSYGQAVIAAARLQE
jgi:hydrogenase maturation protein HypF